MRDITPDNLSKFVKTVQAVINEMDRTHPGHGITFATGQSFGKRLIGQWNAL